MSAIFQRAYAFCRLWEGGESNDPADDGGHTKWGVIQRTYDLFRRSHSLPEQSVSNMSEEECEQLYFDMFWSRSGCYNFGHRLAIVMFDTAVNLGFPRNVSLLQAVVGAKVDGVLGPKTKEAVRKYSEERAAVDVVNARKGYYVSRLYADKENVKWIGGWVNRCDALLEEIGLRG